MRQNIMVYVQHLLGIGHVVRASRIAAALAEAFDVSFVTGGDVPEGILPDGVETLRLPPVKAGPGGFGTLLHADGRPFGEDDKARRRDLLLKLFEHVAPDGLLIEAFPFGRRQMRFELIPLLERARSVPAPPLIVTSIRDILQQTSPGRQAETLDLIRRFVDRVFVHGDRNFASLGGSFPAAAAFEDKIDYTGIVGPESAAASDRTESFDVIVSVGGGAVGAALIAAALAARPLTTVARARWLVLTGPNLPVDRVPAGASEGLAVRRFAPDLPALLGRARLSVSQAGYNTVADLLAAGCRAVLVPYAAGGETEQSHRAALLAARGRAVVIEEAGLDPARLARAIDQALDLDPAATHIATGGAARTTAILQHALAARRLSG